MLENDFDKLDIESYKTGSDAKNDESGASRTMFTRRTYRGRAATIPGKSYFSNRRYSLTDGTTQMRIGSAKRKRMKKPKKMKI